jgi:hypothetical protein
MDQGKAITADMMNTIADEVNSVLNKRQKERYFDSIRLLYSVIENLGFACNGYVVRPDFCDIDLSTSIPECVRVGLALSQDGLTFSCRTRVRV